MLESLLSGLLGVFIGGVLSFLTLRFNYRDLFARTVSNSRMDWINAFREEVATVAAALRRGCSCTEEQRFEAEKARAKLLTRLNQDTTRYGNEYNRVMAEALDFADFTNQDKARAEKLIALSRKILEPEWQRVKHEARGARK